MKLLLRLLGFVAALVAAYFTVRWLFPDLDQESLKEFGVAMPHVVFLPAFTILPLVGLPITPFLLATGMKYGFWLAFLVTSTVMLIHTILAWRLARGFFRVRLQRWFEQTPYSVPELPKKHQTWFAIVFITIPGLPYSLKIYALAMTDIPFRRYVLIVWLCHLVNAIPMIGLGTAAADLDGRLLLLFGALAAASIAGAWWLRRRFTDDSESSPDSTAVSSALAD